jgi:glycosyltransferase involved in cell wall biosynthesis
MKKTGPFRHVVFVYIGDLRTRGRLLKQIATLENAGVECELILGNTTAKPIADGEFSFHVREIPVRLREGKLKTWLGVSHFNHTAAEWIADSNADAACCFSLTTLPACTGAKRRRVGLYVVYDSNELHVENTPGFPQHQLTRLKQWRHARHADAIQHAEMNRLRYFNKTYRYSSKSESVLIENFPDFSGPLQPKPGGVRFIYLGGLAPNRHIEEIIDAFVEGGDGIQIDVFGGGAPSYVKALESRIPAHASHRVKMLGPVANSQVLKILENYHAGFAFYKNVNLNSYWCAPNKIYDYLMSGVAVITNDYPGLRNVVESNYVGFCLPEVTKATILRAIRGMREERPWERINDSLRRKYSWDAQVPSLLATYGIQSVTCSAMDP